MNDVPRQKLQFGIRTLLEIMAVVAFVLVLLYGKATTNDANGRYQMAVGGTDVLLFDAKTGKTWSRHINGGSWRELQPVVPEFEQ